MSYESKAGRLAKKVSDVILHFMYEGGECVVKDQRMYARAQRYLERLRRLNRRSGRILIEVESLGASLENAVESY